jgi:hypothetical protein
VDYPTWFDVIAIGSVAVMAFLLILALFAPGIAYKVSDPEACEPDSPGFLRMIEALTDAQVRRPLWERGYEQFGKLLERQQ